MANPQQVASMMARIIEGQARSARAGRLAEDGTAWFSGQVASVSDDTAQVRLSPGADPVPVGLLPQGPALRLVPAVGADCIGTELPGGVAVIVWASEWQALELQAGAIELNGGAHGGLVQVAPLVQRLNQMDAALNALRTAFNAHTHAVVAVGSPTGPAVPLDSGASTPTTRQDLENTKIKHG